MSIMNRMVRIWRADVHGVMDQLEDKTLLLKQCLRDMEEELFRKENNLKSLIDSKKQMQLERGKHSRENNQLETDLDSAVSKDMDDIARMLIRKRKSLAAHLERLDHHTDKLDFDIKGLQECLAEQRLRYEQFKLRAADFFRSREVKEWEEMMNEFIPHKHASDPSSSSLFPLPFFPPFLSFPSAPLFP